MVACVIEISLVRICSNTDHTFPLSVGKLPFITVGEFGANLPYLGRYDENWTVTVEGLNSLESVEVSKGVADSVGVDKLLKILHQLFFGK